MPVEELAIKWKQIYKLEKLDIIISIHLLLVFSLSEAQFPLHKFTYQKPVSVFVC